MGLSIQFFGFAFDHQVVQVRFRRMYQCLFSALEGFGVAVDYSGTSPRPDADVIILSPWLGKDLETVCARTSAPVALYVPAEGVWFDSDLLRHYAQRVLFAYGTTRSVATEKAYASVGVEYRYLPLATDPDIMRPLGLAHLYDLVFIGGLEHRTGHEGYMSALVKRKNKNDFIVCTGGETLGLPHQSVTWGPIVNQIYNLGRVGVNFHTLEQKLGVETRLDLNNRTFDLAAAGCLQICDNEEAVRECFAEDEVLTREDPGEWIELADHFTRNPDAAQQIALKARKRVLKDHTWSNRAARLLQWIEKDLPRRHYICSSIQPPRLLLAKRAVSAGVVRVRAAVARRIPTSGNYNPQ